MKIKQPTLIDRTIHSITAVYEFDIEGKKVTATFTDNGSGEDADVNNGWKFDLSPCLVDLTEEESNELADEFLEVLYEIDVYED
jgi:hypothetical protein